MKISFIIPTKDRPQYLSRCLKNLSDQKDCIHEVIVVATGMSIQHIIDLYKDVLHIKYIYSEIPGQLYQRKLGLEALDKNSNLIGFLDDDILIQEDALLNILEFIAKRHKMDDYPIGVGFNIINFPSYDDERFKFIKKLTFYLGKEAGQVTKAGANTHIWSIKKDIKTQWLGGGYTIWDRAIIDENKQHLEMTKWATGEDVRYSYPIGKKYNLYVCASAKAINDGPEPLFNYFYAGYKISIAQLFFVNSYSEFSFYAYLKYSFYVIMSNIFTLKINNLKSSLGRFYGILKFVFIKYFNKERIKHILSD